jgi:hypothetical protein
VEEHVELERHVAKVLGQGSPPLTGNTKEPHTATTRPADSRAVERGSEADPPACISP